MITYDGQVPVRRGDVAAFRDEDGHTVCGVIAEIDPLARRVLLISDFEPRGQFVAGGSSPFTGDAGTFALLAHASTWVPVASLLPLSAAGSRSPLPAQTLTHVAEVPEPPPVSQERPFPGGPDSVEIKTNADKVEAAKDAGSEPSESDLYWAVDPRVRESGP